MLTKISLGNIKYLRAIDIAAMEPFFPDEPTERKHGDPSYIFMDLEESINHNIFNTNLNIRYSIKETYDPSDW